MEHSVIGTYMRLADKIQSFGVGSRLAVALVLVFACPNIAAAQLSHGTPYYPSLIVKPAAAKALVEAVRAFDCDDRQKPYCLEPYSVLIQDDGGNFEIVFAANDQRDGFVATVPSHGEVTITRNAGPSIARMPILLPGITSGELALAWSQAEKDGFEHTLSKLDRVEIFIKAGAADIVFIPSRAPEQQTCIAGNCDRRLGYEVRLAGGKVTIR